MSAVWIDRITVATILLAAFAYLAHRIVRRVASAMRPGAAKPGSCGSDCGCGE
jgi:hypothetical protein